MVGWWICHPQTGGDGIDTPTLTPTPRHLRPHRWFCSSFIDILYEFLFNTISICIYITYCFFFPLLFFLPPPPLPGDDLIYPHVNCQILVLRGKKYVCLSYFLFFYYLFFFFFLGMVVCWVFHNYILVFLVHFSLFLPFQKLQLWFCRRTALSK